MTPLFLRAEADLRTACPNWHKDTAQFSFAIIDLIPAEFPINPEPA